MTEAPIGKWIGARPSRVQFAAVMFVGVTAIMIAGRSGSAITAELG